MRKARVVAYSTQRPEPAHQGVTGVSAVSSGLALPVSPVGGVAVSEAGLVGSPSVELSVGLGAEALGVTAGAVVSGDVGVVVEGEVSVGAGALAEAEGEVEAEADGETLASDDGCFLLDGMAVGFVAGTQPLGAGATGDACSLGWGVFVGLGSLFRMSGFTESGMTPASLAAHRPPANKPRARQSTRMLLASSPLINLELVTG